MKKITAILAALVLAISLGAQHNKWTPEDIINTEYAGNISFSPDNSMVVWTKRKASKEKDKFVSDIYLTRLNVMKDGMPLTVQLTTGDENDTSPLFSKDGETIYFLSSRKEGKKLWSLSIYGGEPQEVAEFKNGISNMQWLNDSTFAFISNEGETLYDTQIKEKKDNVEVVEDTVHWKPNRVYSYNLKDKSTQRLTANPHQVDNYRAARDGQWLVYRVIGSPHYGIDANPNPKYYLKNLSNGSERQILQGMQTPGNFQFTADNKGFYFTAVTSSNPQWEGAGISEVYYYDLASNNYTKVPLQWDWAMEGAYQVIGNNVLVALANGATMKLAFYAKNGNTWTKSDLDLGEKNEHVGIASVSFDGKKVAYAHTTASQLPRYYVADLAVNAGKLSFQNEKEMVKLNEKLAKKPKARGEVFKWRGYNGDEVDGILYYPENYEPGKRYPLVVAIHGGPSATDLDEWNDSWAYYPNILSQKGAFTLMPNYHGSSNHGLKYVETIKGNYYEPELEDITKGIDELDKRGMIDRKQMGVMGWSNGAILSTMLIVRYPDMFKVCAPGAGDVNWTSDYGTCEFGVTFDQTYFGGAPWDNLNGKIYNENYILKSPLFEAERIITPTILFHGSDDRAVPRDQSWEFYRALQQIGKAPVRFLWFPEQPHGLQKVTHQLRKMKEEIAWIDQYLFGKKADENLAFKDDSPLAMLLKRDSAAVHNGQFGVWSNNALLPEVVAMKKDSVSFGRFEVTNAQFKQFDTKFTYPAAEANFPARVSLAQAQAYVQWLSKKTGKTYRLPNEQEAKDFHEKAHENGAKENTLQYWAGYAITKDEVPMLREKLAAARSSLIMEVGKFNPVKVGAAELYDLGGNVVEYNAKGGTYGYSAYDYADPNDDAVKPDAKNVGFRVVREK